MCGENLMCPAVVPKFEHADLAIRGCASKKTSALVRSPGNDVDGRRMEGNIEDLRPGTTAGGRSTGWLLAPDQNLPVIRGRG
jgi:hypothetical protein